MPPPPIRRHTLVQIAQVLGVGLAVAVAVTVVIFIAANIGWILLALCLLGGAMSQ